MTSGTCPWKKMVDWITKKNQEMEDKYGVINVAYCGYSGWLQLWGKNKSLWARCKGIKNERSFWRGSYLVGDNEEEG